MWTIEFHRKAQEELREMPESFTKKFKALFDGIRHNGFSNLPRGSVKNISNGIREFRIISKDGIARSLYVAEIGQIVKILVIFVKKTEKTPRDIIEIASKRRDEMQ